MALSAPQTIPHQMARLLNNYQVMVCAKPIQTYYSQHRIYPTKIPMQTLVNTRNKSHFHTQTIITSYFLCSEVYTIFISHP